MEYLPADVTILAYLFVVVSMLSVPLETTRGESVAALRDCRLMGYALLANLSIIPVLSVILARLFDLPLEIRTGFLRLALAPGAVPQLGRLLGVLSIVLCIIATIAAGKDNMPTRTSIGLDAIVAMMALTLCAWAVGWLLGGPEIRNRQVLAIGTSMRHVGVCYSIAAHDFPGTDVVVPILAFNGIAIPMHMLSALITGHMLHDTEVSARPVEACTEATAD